MILYSHLLHTSLSNGEVIFFILQYRILPSSSLSAVFLATMIYWRYFDLTSLCTSLLFNLLLMMNSGSNWPLNAMYSTMLVVIVITSFYIVPYHLFTTCLTGPTIVVHIGLIDFLIPKIRILNINHKSL